MRWVASMVADVHRIMTRGGIFMYPSTPKPGTGRQAAPHVRSQPHGLSRRTGRRAATSGLNWRIPDLQPEKLHQRVPVILGSKNEVLRVTGYHGWAKRNGADSTMSILDQIRAAFASRRNGW